MCKGFKAWRLKEVCIVGSVSKKGSGLCIEEGDGTELDLSSRGMDCEILCLGG